MFQRTDDLRITQVRPLLPPAILLEEIPVTERASNIVAGTRRAIADVLEGRDPRLVAIVGPCSIHDPVAALEYARRLLPLRERYQHELIVVMRTYFEKPRTSVGWKGLINDPDLDESFHINKGLRLARQLLLDVNDLGLPTASEFLDTQIPQHLADLTSWVAIGARTTESQVHRELASGLSMPVGFKNSTDGTTQTAVDAVLSARSPHLFPSVTKQGVSAIFETTGNDTCHVILRGGTPHRAELRSRARARSVRSAARARGLRESVMIDCSHGNSEKDHLRQAARGRVDWRAGGGRVVAHLRDDARKPPRRRAAGLRRRIRGLRPEHHRRLHLARADRTDPRAAGRRATEAGIVPVLRRALVAAVAGRASSGERAQHDVIIPRILSFNRSLACAFEHQRKLLAALSPRALNLAVRHYAFVARADRADEQFEVRVSLRDLGDRNLRAALIHARQRADAAAGLVREVEHAGAGCCPGRSGSLPTSLRDPS